MSGLPGSARAALRVASVPSDHAYVRHLSHPSGDATVVRLPDPPVVGEDGTLRWWPPKVLTPGWLREHADAFDVVHVHFGFESFSPTELARVTQVIQELGKALVVTVHDLHNPHIEDQREQLSRLDVLVPAADAVMTLTRGCADEIGRRWGREAQVIEHPHVVPLDMMAALALRDGVRARPVVGLHLKSLRANTAPLPALAALRQVGDEADVVVTVHKSVLDPHDRGYRGEVVAALTALTTMPHVEVIAHDPMDDETLFQHVAHLDVSLMANRWGTHSGWIEMCHDLGVRVVAPDIGYYREQHAPVLYRAEPAIEPDVILAALREAIAHPRPTPASPSARRAEREHIAAVHERIYRSVSRSASQRTRPS